MTCQLQIQPLTALVPVPRFKIGEHVQWSDKDENGSCSFKGVITEQVYRINYDLMNWQYTIAITEAWIHDVKVIAYCGESKFDLDENLISPYHYFE